MPSVALTSELLRLCAQGTLRALKDDCNLIVLVTDDRTYVTEVVERIQKDAGHIPRLRGRLRGEEGAHSSVKTQLFVLPSHSKKYHDPVDLDTESA